MNKRAHTDVRMASADRDKIFVRDTRTARSALIGGGTSQRRNLIDEQG